MEIVASKNANLRGISHSFSKYCRLAIIFLVSSFSFGCSSAVDSKATCRQLTIFRPVKTVPNGFSLPFRSGQIPSMNQMLDPKEAVVLVSDFAVADDWFASAVESASNIPLPNKQTSTFRSTVRNSWEDDDDEPEDDDLPEEAAPEREDDEPDPFDDFDEEDFDDDFDDDFEEELDDEYQIEPVDDGMLEGHPDAEDIDDELDQDGNPVEFPDDE